MCVVEIGTKYGNLSHGCVDRCVVSVVLDVTQGTRVVGVHMLLQAGEV